MNNDDIWDTILGNDGGGSAAPLTGILGDVGSPPPDSASSVNLAPWSPAGIGGDSITPFLLPQLQDTSAALLPPSAFAPSQPLYDPTPFAPPELTMDQLAMMYGMTPDQVAAIGNQAKVQAVMQIGAKDLLGPVAEYALPELGVEQYLAQIAAKAADTANQMSERSDEQYIEDAPDKALFKRLNDSEIQSIPWAARIWLP